MHACKPQNNTDLNKIEIQIISSHELIVIKTFSL